MMMNGERKKNRQGSINSDWISNPINLAMRKLHPVILLIILTMNSLSAQDTTYYYGVNNLSSGPEGAVLKRDISQTSRNKYKVNIHFKEDGLWKLLFSEKVKIRNENEYLIREYRNGLNTGIYTRKFTETKEGWYAFIDVWETKSLRTGTTSTRFPLTLQDIERKFHKNGEIKSESIYSYNQLISNKNWLENGEEYFENLFYMVSSYPQYKPGTKFLHKYLMEYINQSDFKLENLEGVLNIGFVITDEGAIDGVYVVSSIHPDFDEIALEAVRTLPGEWQPAQVGSKSVNCFLTIPLNFIQSQNTNFEYLDMTFSASTYMLYW